MATIKSTEGKVTITAERGADIQITYVKKSAVRDYFDEANVQFPFGEEYTVGLDEAQGACDPETEAVLILVIQDDEA